MARSGGKISILGALASDYLTFDEAIQLELRMLTDGTLLWLMETLQEGKDEGEFNFTSDAKTKAQMVITNILGAEQLSRVTGQGDFKKAQAAIIRDLINRSI